MFVSEKEKSLFDGNERHRLLRWVVLDSVDHSRAESALLKEPRHGKRYSFSVLCCVVLKCSQCLNLENGPTMLKCSICFSILFFFLLIY